MEIVLVFYGGAFLLDRHAHNIKNGTLFILGVCVCVYVLHITAHIVLLISYGKCPRASVKIRRQSCTGLQEGQRDVFLWSIMKRAGDLGKHHITTESFTYK